MKKLFLSRYFRIVLGLLLSVVSLYLALRGVSLWQVSRSVRQADTAWVMLAVVSVLVNTFLKGIRWYRLTGNVGQSSGFFRVFQALLAGQLLNIIYPARAGDVSRILIVGRNGKDKAFVLGSVLLEKLADMAAFVILAVILFIQLPFPGWLGKSVYLAAGVMLAGMAGVAWLVSSSERSERFGRWLASRQVRWLSESLWLQIIELVQASLSAIGAIRQRKRAWELFVWTVLVWLTAFLNNLLIWKALETNLFQANQVWQAALLVLVGLIAGIAVPSVPGRIGIFEYICVLALSVFGIAQAPALTYGILLHAVVFLPGLLMGVLALLWFSWEPSRQPLTPS